MPHIGTEPLFSSLFFVHSDLYMHYIPPCALTQESLFTFVSAPAMYIKRIYGAASDGLVAMSDSTLSGTFTVRPQGDIHHLAPVMMSPPWGYLLKRMRRNKRVSARSCGVRQRPQGELPQKEVEAEPSQVSADIVTFRRSLTRVPIAGVHRGERRGDRLRREGTQCSNCRYHAVCVGTGFLTRGWGSACAEGSRVEEGRGALVKWTRAG